MTCIKLFLGDYIDSLGRRARWTSLSTCMAAGRSQRRLQSRHSWLLRRLLLSRDAGHRADLCVAVSVWLGPASEELTIAQSTLATLHP
jgi:hypothetical protein